MVGMDLGEACRCLLTAAILGSNSGLRLTQEKSQTTHASVCAKEWSFSRLPQWALTVLFLLGVLGSALTAEGQTSLCLLLPCL